LGALAILFRLQERNCPIRSSVGTGSQRIDERCFGEKLPVETVPNCNGYVSISQIMLMSFQMLDRRHVSAAAIGTERERERTCEKKTG